MDKQPLVDILMATYNGETFLEEQLASLFRQSYPHWRLLIHDDGSTDETLRIVRDAQARDPRILLIDDGVKQLGAARNFLHLLTHSNTPYCMFCDQDDLWMEHKIATLLQAIEKENKPAVAYSNAWFMKGGNVIFRKTSTIHPDTLNNTLFLNAGIQGCSLIMNRPLLQLLPPYPPDVAMHDHLVTMAAVCFGRLIYVDEALMYYRQHGNNATGQQRSGLFSRLSTHADVNLPVVDRRHYLANRAFYKRYSGLLTPVQQHLFGLYFKFVEEAGYLERIYLVLKGRFQLGNKKGRLLLKTILRKPVN